MKRTLHSRNGDRFDISLTLWVGCSLLTLLIGFCGFIAWAAQAPLSSAIVVAGQIVVEQRRRQIEHPFGGVIHELKVREGQSVQAGEVLLVLEDPARTSRFRQLEDERLTLKQQLTRLQSEKSGIDELLWPVHDEGSSPALMFIRAEQSSLFSQRRAHQQQMASILDQRIHQATSRRQAYIGLTNGDRTTAELLQQEIQAYQTLASKGFTAEAETLRLARRLAEIQGRLEENRNLAEAEQQLINELQLEKSRQKTQWRESIDTEISLSTARLRALEAELDSAGTELAWAQIRSPVPGIVMNVQITQGSVALAGDTLLEIIPIKDNLLVEALLLPKDIDRAIEGMQASIRITAWDRTTATIPGTISLVSADRIPQSERSPDGYKVQVKMDEEYVKNNLEFTLSPGMPAEVYLLQDQKTLLQYMVEPMIRTIQRGFREP